MGLSQKSAGMHLLYFLYRVHLTLDILFLEDVMRNRNVAILLSMMLGFTGSQFFYLGSTGAGVISVLFCWTGIPALVSFIKGISLMCMSQSEFDNAYNDGKCSDVCMCLTTIANASKKQNAELLKATNDSKPENPLVDDMPNF